MKKISFTEDEFEEGIKKIVNMMAWINDTMQMGNGPHADDKMKEDWKKDCRKAFKKAD